MRYGNSPKWKRVLSSPLTLLAAFLVFSFLTKVTWNIYAKADQSQIKLNQLQAELSKISNTENDLSNKVIYLSSDDGKAAEVRTKYHAVRDGEMVAVIIDDTPKPSGTTSALVASPEHWWKKLFQVIGL